MYAVHTLQLMFNVKAATVRNYVHSKHVLYMYNDSIYQRSALKHLLIAVIVYNIAHCNILSLTAMFTYLRGSSCRRGAHMKETSRSIAYNKTHSIRKTNGILTGETCLCR